MTAVKQRFSDSLRDVAKGVVKPVPPSDAMKASVCARERWGAGGRGEGKAAAPDKRIGRGNMDKIDTRRHITQRRS